MRDLAAAIDASDVRAYLDISNEPGLWRGVTSFVSASAGIRIVNVKINGALDKLERLAVLGHELQHVREVASAPEVINQAGMLKLLQTLGHPSSGCG